MYNQLSNSILGLDRQLAPVVLAGNHTTPEVLYKYKDFLDIDVLPDKPNNYKKCIKGTVWEVMEQESRKESILDLEWNRFDLAFYGI